MIEVASWVEIGSVQSINQSIKIRLLSGMTPVTSRLTITHSG